MNKFNDICQTIHKELVKYSPEILTGLGVAGMWSSLIFAVKATPKALKLIEERKEESKVEKLPAVEIVKTTWKCYIPSAAIAITSTACLIGATAVNSKRNAVLAAACSLSERAFEEYRKKVVETIGSKKEDEIKDAIAKDRIKNNPIENKEVIITGKGESLCYDQISGRYFKSDIETLRRIQNDLNRDMLSDMYISLNEFYIEIGLDGIDIGDELGWNINRGMIDLKFSSHLTDDGTPCLVVDHRIPPRYNFMSD